MWSCELAYNHMNTLPFMPIPSLEYIYVFVHKRFCVYIAYMCCMLCTGWYIGVVHLVYKAVMQWCKYVSWGSSIIDVCCAFECVCPNRMWTCLLLFKLMHDSALIVAHRLVLTVSSICPLACSKLLQHALHLRTAVLKLVLCLFVSRWCGWLR